MDGLETEFTGPDFQFVFEQGQALASLSCTDEKMVVSYQGEDTTIVVEARGR